MQAVREVKTMGQPLVTYFSRTAAFTRVHDCLQLTVLECWYACVGHTTIGELTKAISRDWRTKVSSGKRLTRNCLKTTKDSIGNHSTHIDVSSYETFNFPKLQITFAGWRNRCRFRTLNTADDVIVAMVGNTDFRFASVRLQTIRWYLAGKADDACRRV